MEGEIVVFKTDVCLRAFWHSKRKKKIAKAKASKKISLCCLYSACYLAVGVWQWRGEWWLHIISSFSVPLLPTHTAHTSTLSLEVPFTRVPPPLAWGTACVPQLLGSSGGKRPKEHQDISGSCGIEREWFVNEEWWHEEGKFGGNYQGKGETNISFVPGSGIALSSHESLCYGEGGGCQFVSKAAYKQQSEAKDLWVSGWSFQQPDTAQGRWTSPSGMITELSHGHSVWPGRRALLTSCFQGWKLPHESLLPRCSAVAGL